jgi:hypothetical protein
MSNVNQPAFRAEGPTVFQNVTATSVAVQVLVTSNRHVRIYNAGANVVYIRAGKSDVAAVIPTAGSPQWGLPIAPGEVEVMRIADGDSQGYIAAIAAVAGPSRLLHPRRRHLMRRLFAATALASAIVFGVVSANAAMKYGSGKFGAFGTKGNGGGGGGGFTPPPADCLLVDVGNCLLVDTGNKLLVQ